MVDIKYSKDTIANLVQEGRTVSEMSKLLNVDFEELSRFYLSCFAENKEVFPLKLLVTKSWLEQKLETNTIAQISRELNVSFSVIERLMSIYGIPKKPALHEVLTSEILYELFVIQGLYDKQIAEKYKCSIVSIKKLKKKYNISYELRKNAINFPDIELFKKLYVDYSFTEAQLSKLIGCSITQLKNLRIKYSNSNHPLADDIRKRTRPINFYQEIISLLFEKLLPEIFYAQLQLHSLIKIAQMYNVIPQSDNEYEVFSKEWLEEKLKSNTLTSISEAYHISKYDLSKLKKIYNIQFPTKKANLDYDTIKFLYIDCGWKRKKIAEMYGVSVSLLESFLKKHNISSNDRIKLNEILTPKVFHELYVDEYLTLKEIASIFSVHEQDIFKLKKIYSETDTALTKRHTKRASAERIEFLTKKYRFRAFK